MFVSTQAKILAVVAVIELILSFAAAIRTSGIPWAILAFAVGIIVILILIMDQDCVVTGGCNIWAWVKVALTSLFLVLSIALSIVMLWKGKAISATELVSSDEENKDSSSKQEK